MSNTAQYGDVTRGPRVIDENVRAEMERILGEIQSGEFAREWIAESRAGAQNLLTTRKAEQDQLVEQVGRELRDMMPFLVPKTPGD